MRSASVAMMWLAVATGAATMANERVVRRCVGGDGAVSWQSAPCAGGAREDAVRALPPQTVDAVPPAPDTTRATARTVPASRSPRRVAAAGPGTDVTRRRCAAARREADAQRERLWNRLGFVERSQLDAEVARACAR